MRCVDLQLTLFVISGGIRKITKRSLFVANSSVVERNSIVWTYFNGMKSDSELNHLFFSHESRIIYSLDNSNELSNAVSRATSIVSQRSEANVDPSVIAQGNTTSTAEVPTTVSNDVPVSVYPSNFIAPQPNVVSVPR